MTDLNIDAIIKQLNEVRTTGKQAQLSESKIRQLCNISREIFLEDSNLLEINAPVHIFGDIHGQFEDLLRHFDLVGTPDTERCLFLGDYVDRIYGFYDECKRRYNIKLWKTFTDCFNCLPLAAIVENTIFCVHGGLSPDLNDLDQIRQMVRPMDIPDHGIAADLLWSDPDEDITGWGDNDRGVSWTFGGDIVQTFLKKNNFSLVARAHQVVEDGYQFFQKRKLVTLFSAPNYCGEFDNAAAVMSVSAELLCSFCITKPKSVLEFEEEMKKIKK